MAFTDLQLERIIDLKRQIRVLRGLAIHQANEGEDLAEIFQVGKLGSEVIMDYEEYDEVIERLRYALNFLSASIPKEKPGGWIVDQSLVYRAEFHGRVAGKWKYRNRDTINVEMVNGKYHTEDQIHARAIQVGNALNDVALLALKDA